MNWGKTLMGAASGFLTGGPAGAAVGALGGALSGGGNTTTGATAQQVRAMTPEERKRYEAAQGMSMANMQMLQPGALDARRDEIGGELQATLEGKLGMRYEKEKARQSESLMARGMGGGSSAAAMKSSLFGQTQQALGMGTLQAKTQAGNMALNELASYRANLGATESIFSGIESARRGSISGTQSQTGPDTSTADILGMGMSALTDSDSAWNKEGGWGDTVKGWGDDNKWLS